MTTTDRVSKVLERVALECMREANEAVSWGGSVNAACRRVLESRLGPLLRAGQAMSKELTFSNACEWDACLAALEREGQ